MDNQELSTQTNINPEPTEKQTPPVVTQPSIEGEPKKSKKKLWLVIAILLLASAATAAYFFMFKEKPAINTGAVEQKLNLKPAKTQYSSSNSVSGYIEYEPSKFEEVKDLDFPKLEELDPEVNSIISYGGSLGWEGGGLYLYDLVNNSAFKLADSGGQPRIMSDHYLVYSVDEGSGKNKKLGAKLLNLKTGDTRMVFAEAPEDVSGNPCCTVSPDGFRLAYVKKDKITVWDIRDNSYTDYKVSASPIGEGFSRERADYNVEMGYAQPKWADNNTLVFTDKPATKTVMDGNSANKVVVDSDLFVLSLQDGKVREIPTEDSGIYDLFVTDEWVVIHESFETQSASRLNRLGLNKLDEPKFLAYPMGSVIQGPQKNKLYLFSSMHSSTAYSVVDIETGENSRFNPSLSSLDIISQILPLGFADSKRMILDVRKVEGSPRVQYLTIYNLQTDTTEKSIQIDCEVITSESVVKCEE